MIKIITIILQTIIAFNFGVLAGSWWSSRRRPSMRWIKKQIDYQCNNCKGAISPEVPYHMRSYPFPALPRYCPYCGEQAIEIDIQHIEEDSQDIVYKPIDSQIVKR